MKQFIACFADDATVFFPMPEPPECVQGKQAVQQRFEHVFASLRSTAKSGPPFHHLAPEDLTIQLCPGRPLLSHSSLEMQSGSRVELLCLRR
jgi:hypothetical protein